ncbi:protein lethal(2)essential for life [Anabrus simplex]|uniref:protein lethal(2)essential for life n=1 Tax=Anabrus simplex TaxID=316456 RepID=UPI0035A3A55F
MSLLPYVMNIFDSLEFLNERSSSLFNQNFGLGVFEDDLLQSSQVLPRRQRYVRPWRRQSARQSGFSRVENNKDTFKIYLDVEQFKPEEIHVKLVGNNVVVQGKHEERPDEHGQIAREFERRYYLPRTVDKDAITSNLSSDGILIIEAPKKPLPPPEEREITVTETGAPARIQAGRRQRAISQ